MTDSFVSGGLECSGVSLTRVLLLPSGVMRLRKSLILVYLKGALFCGLVDQYVGVDRECCLLGTRCFYLFES